MGSSGELTTSDNALVQGHGQTATQLLGCAGDAQRARGVGFDAVRR